MTFSKLDQHWSAFYITGRSFIALKNEHLDTVLSYQTGTDRTHLDIGCGTGELCVQLSKAGYTSTGIDPSAKAIEQAAQQHYSSDITFVHSDFASFASKTKYSLITIKYVVAFIDNLPLFMEKVASLLQVNGLLVIVTPYKQDVDKNMARISVDKDGLAKALEPKFDIIKEFKSDIDSVLICKLNNQAN